MSRASERQRQKYTPWLLGALLLSQLVLMAVYSRHRAGDDGTEQSVLRSWTISVVAPVQSGVGYLLSGVGSIWHGYVDLRGVRARNQDLETENAQLRSEIEAARVAAAENERLRRELDLKPMLKYDSVAAEVVARDSTEYFKRVTIDKGSTAGIQKNQPVVTPDGLVGRVVAVGPFAAEVQLVTDVQAGVNGKLTRSQVGGDLKGHDDGRCRFRSIGGLDVGKDVGDAILTTGLDRIYPPGILVGYVESIQPGTGSSPLDVEVRPAADLNGLSSVLVLKVSPKDLSTPETVK